MVDQHPFLRVRGDQLVTPDATPVRLRGVGLGGWMNMENFITGYPGNETAMRREVGRVLGPARAGMFFDRLLTAFFTDADAALLAGAGLNCVRLPVNYRHLEDDAAPMVVREEGFHHLDRVVEACARVGIYTIIDLHALPGAQNHHWHSDNPTHVAGLWEHRHFQDRAVHLWEAIADRYKNHPHVAGYNPVNEPADERGEVVGPFSRRLVAAIRAVDPHHTVFLDGNRYSTEFDAFGEPMDNTVYVCHDYTLAGFADGGDYPGETRGAWYDRGTLEAKFLERTEFQRRTGTPVWVGEFGPMYTGDPERDRHRYRVLEDQLGIYAQYGASWSLWTYKDVGLQGVVSPRPDTPYMRHFAGIFAKKARLGVDSWGGSDAAIREVTEPVRQLIETEFPDFDPYPWGARKWADVLLRHILLAEPLTVEYAERFRDLDDERLLALADSFALEHCDRRERLVELLGKG